MKGSTKRPTYAIFTSSRIFIAICSRGSREVLIGGRVNAVSYLGKGVGISRGVVNYAVVGEYSRLVGKCLPRDKALSRELLAMGVYPVTRSALSSMTMTFRAQKLRHFSNRVIFRK